MGKTEPVINTQYEVEIRCRFDSAEEACKIIPFLRVCLKHEMVWSSGIYGEEFFKAGRLLRMSKTTIDGETKYFMGWKGEDNGIFANIREEIDEVVTNGVTDSRILEKLGSQIRTLPRNKISAEFKKLGYKRFMSWRGADIFGDYKPLGVSMKLMTCRTLRWPVLVEIEKSAKTKEEAIVRENELRDFCGRFGLNDRLVREEPPTLLHEARFGQKRYK
jgi:adenylate cyclase class IV